MQTLITPVDQTKSRLAWPITFLLELRRLNEQQTNVVPSAAAFDAYLAAAQELVARLVPATPGATVSAAYQAPPTVTDDLTTATVVFASSDSTSTLNSFIVTLV